MSSSFIQIPLRVNVAVCECMHSGICLVMNEWYVWMNEWNVNVKRKDNNIYAVNKNADEVDNKRIDTNISLKKYF